jgi:NAD(P)-dependent dehydrogenase (short-subunit alcohol dehydrogenase family)
MSVYVSLDLNLQDQVSGKTAIITGGANGIGAATAALYNRHGANVVIADLPSSQVSAGALIKTLAWPERSLFVPVDILDWTQMKRIFKQTVERFGHIDVVVANAGIMESSPVLDLEGVDSNGDLHESKEAFKVLDVNIKGTFNSKSKL